jgi:hypothetical protein
MRNPWTPEEEVRVEALADDVRKAWPDRHVHAYLRTCDELTGVLLPRARWRWTISLEWDDGGVAHGRAVEVATIDDLAVAVPRWLEVLS